MKQASRRRWLAGAAGFGGVALAARMAGEHGLVPPDAGGIYGLGHTLTYAGQRLLMGSANAREFSRSQISAIPHPSTKVPKGEEFGRLRAEGFRDWKLQVEGMVSRQRTLSMADIRSYPVKSQITQLICEEGWSYIAEWTGVPLAHVLEVAGMQAGARFVLCEAMDGWVDALDMNDALHGQTLVTYGMNGGDLPVGHGGPLRLRVPRQLGYKSLKFVRKMTVTDSLKDLPGGSDYSWYAGI